MLSQVLCLHLIDDASMKAPPKRKGNPVLTVPARQGRCRLNESLSKKKGNSAPAQPQIHPSSPQ